MEEPRNEEKHDDNPFATIHKDFESFKKAVDQAIERDPYGALFGRRIRSPPTNNNSSWTSFAWIFDPREIKQESAESSNDAPKSKSTPGPLSSPISPSQATSSQSSTANAAPSPIPTSQSDAPDEYEYDPISMRKVPRGKAETFPLPQTSQQMPPQPPKAPEPPKSSPEPESETKSSTRPEQPSNARSATPKAAPKSEQRPARSFFDTLFGENGVDIPVKTYKPHRVYGYSPEAQADKETAPQSPKRTVGFETNRKRELASLRASTLGNTIDTTAEYGGKWSDQKAAERAPSPQPRNPTEPPDDAPLFSGTTYEGRSDATLHSMKPKSDWLKKEGFGSEQKDSSIAGESVDMPAKTFKASLTTEKSTPIRLESALDRHRRASSVSERKSATTDDRPEDLDFLRASDVRAAARTMRTTKLEKQQRKYETRNKLEQDFSSQPKHFDLGSLTNDNRTVMKKSLGNVWKHVQDYPDGIVARTVKSMGIFNDNWRHYVRPEPRVDLTKKLEFKDETLSKVASIYKPRKTSKAISFSPSQEVLDAERANIERMRALQRANESAKTDSAAQAAQAERLARDIKHEYEKEFGRISPQHRQAEHRPERPHPLSTATVKEGIARYPAIEEHVSKFEPEFSKLVQETKSIRRELHEAKLNLRRLAETFKRTPWSQVEACQENDESLASGLDEPVTAHSLPEVKPQSTAPSQVQEAIFTPDGSAEWNDEQPPTISELKRAFAAPFVILKYDADSDNVTRLTAHFHEAGEREPPTPLSILAKLKRTEKFFPYFEQLQNQRYEIVSGDSDTLIFQKTKDPGRLVPEHEQAFTQRVIQEPLISQYQSPGVTPPPQHAATVLDEMPIDIEPIPGPAAPTAPPTTPTSKPASKPASTPTPTPTPASEPTKPSSTPPPIPSASSRTSARIKRQESVFSGTIPTPTRTGRTNPIDPEIASPRTLPSSSDSTAYSEPEPEREFEPTQTRSSTLRTFLRTLNRVFLTVIGVGVGAYTVGVVSEGLNAKAQQKGLSGVDGEVGPRKRIVLTDPSLNGNANASANMRRRPGIFSTEDSR